jgi:hypothetical protein
MAQKKQKMRNHHVVNMIIRTGNHQGAHKNKKKRGDRSSRKRRAINQSIDSGS